MGARNWIDRRLAHVALQPPSVLTAAKVITVTTIAVVIGGGALMRLLDPTEYANVWVGLWWSIQTVTTVGYGDVTPRDVAGRIVASVVMIQGVAFVTIITAAITSSFINRAARRLDQAGTDRSPGDLERLDARLDELERKLDGIAAALRQPGAGG